LQAAASPTVRSRIAVLTRTIRIPNRLRRLEQRVDGIDSRARAAQATSSVTLEEIQSQLGQLARSLKKPIKGTPTDARFLEAASVVLAHGRTKLERDRLYVLWQAARNTAHLGAAAAEVGTYRGGSAYFIALAFRMHLGHEVPLEAIDTYQGHPQDKLSDVDPPSHKTPGAFAKTSYEQVVGYLREFEQTTVRKGELTAIADELPHRRYQLVHLDVDLYESTRDCLAYFADRVVPRGVIVLDDYDAPNCPGVRRAAEELLATDDRWQTWHPHTEQLIMTRLA
jgi:O-methyltransferase